MSDCKVFSSKKRLYPRLVIILVINVLSVHLKTLKEKPSVKEGTPNCYVLKKN